MGTGDLGCRDPSAAGTPSAMGTQGASPGHTASRQSPQEPGAEALPGRPTVGRQRLPGNAAGQLTAGQPTARQRGTRYRVTVGALLLLVGAAAWLGGGEVGTRVRLRGPALAVRAQQQRRMLQEGTRRLQAAASGARGGGGGQASAEPLPQGGGGGKAIWVPFPQGGGGGNASAKSLSQGGGEGKAIGVPLPQGGGGGNASARSLSQGGEEGQAIGVPLPQGGGVAQPLSPQDSELFARALATEAAATGAPRVAFLFLVRGSLPLGPLWARFFKGGHQDQYSVYVHTEEWHQYSDKDIPAVFRGRQIPSKAMQWGAVSMLDAERRLLANALLDPRNTHFVLLCKSTAPLLDFNATFQFITGAPSSFLATGMPSRHTWTPQFLPRVPEAEWRRGEAWFALQRRHAAVAVADEQYYAKFKEVSLPHGNEEHYLQTLLSKNGGGGLTDHSLVFAEWSHAAEEAPLLHHPRTFHAPDVTPQLLLRALGLRCAADGYRWWRCSLFARRFADDALQPLMGLLPLTIPANGTAPESPKNRSGKGPGKGPEGAPSTGQKGKEDPLYCPEDEELFKKALATQPSSGAPRVAFLFLVRGPLPLAPVWAKFFDGQPKENFSIYIHSSEDPTPNETLPEVFQGRHVPSKPTKYGTVTLVDGERRLLANALLDPGNTHFVLACESTVPLFSFPFSYAHLTAQPKSLLMNFFNTGFRWTKAFLPLIPKVDWGKGGAWFALRRRHARMVVADREYYRYFKRVKIGIYDEHYYQTLLYKKDPKGMVRFTPIAVRWRGGPHFRISSTHPVTFDYWRINPGLLADMAGPYCAPGNPKRWKCYLFARKFSPTALEPLLRILPLPKAPTPADVDRMEEQWASPPPVRLPPGVPGAGRAAGSYLQAWRGQVEEDRKGLREGGGGGGGAPVPVLSPEEEELFGRALRVEPGGAPRVAFLFLVRDEFLLAPLWAKFFEGGKRDAFSVYVYAGRPEYKRTPLPEVFRSATTIHWEGKNGKTLSVVEGVRRLLATALLDPRNSQFILLCEATVPLFNFTFTANYLTRTPHSFVDSAPGVWDHWKPSFDALFPRSDWRVGEPWGAMLQRPHAVLVASDTAYYRAFSQAGMVEAFEARSYLPTLIGRQDPGSFFNRTLTYNCYPSLGPGPKNPSESAVTFYFWDVLPGLISHMASPLCSYSHTGTPSGNGTGEGSKQPCFLFARKLHGDAIEGLVRVLPARDVPYYGGGRHAEPYTGLIRANPWH